MVSLRVDILAGDVGVFVVKKLKLWVRILRRKEQRVVDVKNESGYRDLRKPVRFLGVHTRISGAAVGM